jgi:hypothetical protein
VLDRIITVCCTHCGMRCSKSSGRRGSLASGCREGFVGWEGLRRQLMVGRGGSGAKGVLLGKQ